MPTSSISQPQNRGQNRGRSSVKFPYSDLSDSVEVAKTTYGRAGERCSFSQLSAYLGYNSVESGAFRLRVSSAKLFGLLEIERGHVRLLPLGRQIIDPLSSAAARKEAFLAVPLYRKIFERYDGYQLPPDVGLEREIARLGVTEKQLSKARQTFQRSAEQAGFFASGSDRLVAPLRASVAKMTPIETSRAEKSLMEEAREESGMSSDAAAQEMHPLVRALIETVPPSSSPWPQQQRQQWLETAANIFRLVYGD